MGSYIRIPDAERDWHDSPGMTQSHMTLGVQRDRCWLAKGRSGRTSDYGMSLGGNLEPKRTRYDFVSSGSFLTEGISTTCKRPGVLLDPYQGVVRVLLEGLCLR